MKLWDKGYDVSKAIETFTVGKDRELDLFLAPWDILGTMAHITMLESIGLIESDEHRQLMAALREIYPSTLDGTFRIEDGMEDVHSQVEWMLTQQLGDMGKKVHSGRSRNDQVLVDLKLYFLDEIRQLVEHTMQLFGTLQMLSERHKDILIPGYTHYQVAMPSSFGLWFGAYAESLVDDMQFLQAAWKVANQNPLGSAAGYGSSFPLNRTMTTQLLGFDDLSYNVVYAQMGRGKTEKLLAFALSSIASTLNKLASDVCQYMSQNYGFLTFPKELTTGSSIMPHKQNPDVFELVRAHTNKLQALPMEIGMIISNLPSGYHRDLQLTKESLLPAIEQMKSCLGITDYMLQQVIVKEGIVEDKLYDYLFSVEVLNREVLKGVPFRDAYKMIGEQINAGNFQPERSVEHTHEGSIGNLCNEEIAAKMNRALDGISIGRFRAAIDKLVKG
ncbi:argininosuccinate lyase [Pontibacter sp. G13]|uniref:argininosuccinate lyase n=1 Tax=Pontibacter sp. G13 TaxID=3074898 RepID=UPI0028891ED3|nr:argininosuccinate lyase [Pontibacter sp. G13]WNJ21060.1 argininosuccinate lyase [Pontibacter sp. G13]